MGMFKRGILDEIYSPYFTEIAPCSCVLEDVLEITDLVDFKSISGLGEKVFMFNPMGMAIYDISVAKFYYDLAKETKTYIQLED